MGRAINRLGLLAMVAVAAWGLQGCASGGGGKIVKTPAWYTDVPEETGYYYSAQVAESRNMQVATKKAKTAARAELAQQMGSKVENLEKLFQEEVGNDGDSELLESFSSVTKTVTSEMLNGAKEAEKESRQLENGQFRVYVLMGINLLDTNKALMEKMKAEEHLYTRFRASKAHDELAKEIETYEASQQ
ncbi:MAG: hypothetical protein GKR89_12060 [Candidatus Latescibacteria bacterium]|nr:hypothetical protein [Candidatus Latescibacterota bacterium]